MSTNINTTKVSSTILSLIIKSEDEKTFTRPKNKNRTRKTFLSHPVKYVIQNKLPSPPLPKKIMKSSSNIILENVSPNYSRTFGDNIITKPNHMTRVLCQHIVSLGISIDSHKFEIIYEAMYDNEVDIGYLIKRNTHQQHKITLPNTKQVMR